MEDKLFDQIIKGKLEQVQATDQADSWQVLASKLDAMEVRPETDTRFDRLAQERLGNPTELPFESAHWAQLAARMDQSNTLIQRLRTAKVAELAILLLTLLNLDAFTSGPNRWQYPPSHKKQEVAAQDLNNSSKPVAIDAKQSEDSQPETTVDKVRLEVNQRDAKQSAQRKAAHTRTHVIRTGSIFRPQPIAAVQPDQTSDTNMLEAIALGEQSDLDQTRLQSASQIQVLEASDYSVVETIPTLAANPIPEAIMSNPLVRPLLKSARQRAKWEMMVFAGPDYVKVSGANASNTRGYTGGMHIARKMGKWRVETGLDYAHLPYQAKPVREVVAGNLATGQIGRILKRVDLDLVSVPVRVGRSLWKHKRTEISVMAGPQLVATAAVTRDYDSFYTPGSQPDPTPASLPRVPAAPPVQGLFEGGSLKDNIHLAAQVAVRAEHRLGASNKSLFVEANAQKMLTNNKLGQADDRFSGVGLRTGLIAML